jgi:hypothetical protein
MYVPEESPASRGHARSTWSLVRGWRMDALGYLRRVSPKSRGFLNPRDALVERSTSVNRNVTVPDGRSSRVTPSQTIIHRPTTGATSLGRTASWLARRRTGPPTATGKPGRRGRRAAGRRRAVASSLLPIVGMGAAGDGGRQSPIGQARVSDVREFRIPGGWDPEPGQAAPLDVQGRPPTSWTLGRDREKRRTRRSCDACRSSGSCRSHAA